LEHLIWWAAHLTRGLLLVVPIASVITLYLLARHHFWARRALARSTRAVLLLIMPALLALRRRLPWRKRPAWVVTGECVRCGDCCELLAIHAPLSGPFHNQFRLLTIWYFEEIHHFRLAGFRGDGWMLFTCARLGEDRQCADYARRPAICRQYPAGPLGGVPNLSARCGFHVVLPDNEDRLTGKH